MHDSREDELARLREQNQQLTTQLVALERAHHQLQCDLRLAVDELAWREEKIRGLERLVGRLSAGRQA